MDYLVAWRLSKEINETGCFKYINGECDLCDLCEIYNEENDWDYQDGDESNDL